MTMSDVSLIELEITGTIKITSMEDYKTQVEMILDVLESMMDGLVARGEPVTREDNNDK